MRRLIALLGLVLALGLSGTASADTFSVVHHHSSGGGGSATFSTSGSVIPFFTTQSEPTSFLALRSIWQAAGARYGVPWTVLAAINKVETNFGQNLGPSSAGAVGWMQFMPSTWARWGVDANGDGIADPDNPTDAIFSAARYLAGCGGQFDIAQAVYCYNHSTSYVADVLRLAAQYGRAGGAGPLSGGGLQQVQLDLGPQIDSARKQVAAARAQLVVARAKASRLGRSERRLLHVAATARLLSDELQARKSAVLLDIRRAAAEARASRLRKLVDAASSRLGRLRDQASMPVFIPTTGASGGGAVSIALQYLGVPYVWAGASPSGFDCSGLMQYVYGQLGISLPHNTVAQWNDPALVSVPRNQLQPGDLVFFDNLDHVGMYIGYGEIIDAPHTGAVVRIDTLSRGWYHDRYDGAKRVVAAQSGLAQPGGAITFTSNGAGSSSFTSDVVYFTH